MSLFLHVVPVSEAIATVRKIAPNLPAEVVPLAESCRRVLAADVMSDIDIPGFDRSVVDGYAVIAADTIGAGDAIPAMLRLSGRVAMGQQPDASVEGGSCIYVPTGGVLPKGANAVVMIEHAEAVGDEILIKKPVAHGENVLFRDEDFAKGSVVLARRKRLSPQDTGVLAATGSLKVPVIKTPVIGIISTGNEIVPPDTVPAPGRIRDVNSYLCGSFVQERGCRPVYYGIIRDEREGLKTALGRALGECDAVLISGGSSKDDRDVAAAVIGDLGTVLIHGISIAPGKPTIIGTCAGKPVIGLPGHPASAFIVLFVIGSHLLAAMCGEGEARFRSRPAVLAANIPSARGREDYVRVRLENGRAFPLFGKSGLLNTLVKGDGVVRVPAGTEGFEPGAEVEVILW